MKYLENLNMEELKKVYEVNSKVQNSVYNHYYETIIFWLNDYLEVFKNCVDFEINLCRYRNYFTIKNNKVMDFMEALKIAQRNYCFLEDRYNEDIEVLEKLMDLEDSYDLDNRFDNLRDIIEKLLTELQDACLKRLELELEPLENESDLLTYFLEFWVEDKICNSPQKFYIDEDFVLYEKVIKSYK